MALNYRQIERREKKKEGERREKKREGKNRSKRMKAMRRGRNRLLSLVGPSRRLNKNRRFRLPFHWRTVISFGSAADGVIQQVLSHLRTFRPERYSP